MRFKKPFRAVPIKPDPAYMQRRADRLPAPASTGKAGKLRLVPTPERKPVAAGQRHASATPRFLRKRPIRARRWGHRKVRSIVAVLLGAVVLGLMGGLGSTAIETGDFEELRHFAVATGLARARSPQPGDYWSRCADARKAGTYPIAKGEPGYRPQLDSDRDGIACERRFYGRSNVTSSLRHWPLRM
ncbi:excalibur calcium-binding domain-containing protein [Croceicoccus bisphenolivorans]|uniref:excalibur calcium-binding domain-containing protein n=1 Tax=Croceicoccus bisphenolivorans TaxID=1783232 RepID=UPI00082FEB6A|nr:excalibur calcium-binding domain-containing protein [Croceicoccus bisphenolivorans]